MFIWLVLDDRLTPCCEAVLSLDYAPNNTRNAAAKANDAGSGVPSRAPPNAQIPSQTQHSSNDVENVTQTGRLRSASCAFADWKSDLDMGKAGGQRSQQDFGLKAEPNRVNRFAAKKGNRVDVQSVVVAHVAAENQVDAACVKRRENASAQWSNFRVDRIGGHNVRSAEVSEQLSARLVRPSIIRRNVDEVLAPGILVSRPVCMTYAFVALVVKHPDPRGLCPKPIGNLLCPVRAAIIHDDDLKVVSGLREGSAHGFDSRLDVLNFVECRNQDAY